MSKGELYISQLLTNENYIFQQEKSFNDLRQGRFKYDFYIINKKDSKNSAISFPVLLEFDGRQHFEIVPKYQQSYLDLNKQKGYDRRKNNYALANKISLYRIPYWELENIKYVEDLFNDKFLVKTQFHNDNIWQLHLRKGG